jgi:hypothetical protein
VVDPADPLPPEDEREHLLDALADLVDARGFAHFVGAPIVRPEVEFFPDVWTPDAIGVHRLAERLLRYAGLDELRVAVEIFAEGEVPPGDPLVRSERHQGAAAWFAGIHDGVALFGANVQQLGDPLGVTAAMAHEAAHAFRCAHALEVDDLLTEEQLTDLTTVYLGFGVLTTKSTVRHRSENVDGTPWVSRFERTMLGYLAPQSMAFLLACQVALRGEDVRAIAKELEANQARYLENAMRWLAENVADLGARLGVPAREAWPEPRDLAELTAPIARDVELEPAAEEQREVEFQDTPVVRVPFSRAFAAMMFGGLLGVGTAMALLDVVPVISLAAIVVLPIAGHRLGRAWPTWECSGCGGKVVPADRRCPACNGLFVADLERAEDRLDVDPWALMRQRVGKGLPGDDPYRDVGEPASEADPEELHPSLVDGSQLPRVGSVMLCSQDLLLARRSEVEALARRLDVTFPPDYVDYVTTLGAGLDTDFVRVQTPDRIVATREPLADGHLVIARTEDGDRIVVHPGGSCQLQLLPADGSTPQSLGDRLHHAIEELLGTSTRWFVPDTLQERFVATVQELAIDDVLDVVLEFGPVYAEDAETQHTILCAAIGGTIAIDRVDGAWRIEVATDRQNVDTARRLVEALQREALELAD